MWPQHVESVSSAPTCDSCFGLSISLEKRLIRSHLALSYGRLKIHMPSSPPKSIFPHSNSSPEKEWWSRMKIKLAQNRSGVSAMVLSFGHLDIYLHVIIFQVFHSRSPPTKFGPCALLGEHLEAATQEKVPMHPEQQSNDREKEPQSTRESVGMAGFGRIWHGMPWESYHEIVGNPGWFLTMKSRGFLANVTSHHPILWIIPLPWKVVILRSFRGGWHQFWLPFALA